ncbi:hypothetical protein HPOKI112_04630 [Helicobacter pylori oki112]|nr:hypothetical protein HPOKI112_04630 [Helicobacter pylori oki112]AHN40648.1 hypothetical protein HPOKI422_04600 [Helicobacter pylori oki422]
MVEAKDKEAFLQGIEEKLKDSATPLPKGMSVAEFKQSLESVENKDRFLEHLETRDNSQDRLKFLSLIEPILREPHIEIFIKDKDGTLKKEYIKAFKDENNTRLYMLITQDNDTILRTFIPKLNERHMRSHVRDADIIHSFIQPNRTAKSDNALSDVVVYGENNTPKPLNSQEDLLKTSENLNETPPKPTHLSPLEQANAKNLLKEQRATTPLKEFGTNYPEFALKPKEALEKLLQEKNGQVAGAAYREDLGGIDFVWGTPKTKDSNGYGLAHILEKREKQCKRLGLTNEQAKERTKELLKQIPEVIEKGIKDNDYIGHATIRHNGIEVGLSSQKGNTPLKNHYMITSFETDEKVLRELETIGTLSNNYRDGINYSTSNLNNPNPTTNALKTQEPLSEQANAKKLLKLESEKGIKAEVLKKLDFDEIKKLIDESPRTGSSMPILGMQNLNAEAVEYIQKNHKRIAVEKIEPSFAKDLKLKYPDDVRAVIDYQAINHILKEHKNLAFEDIANYRELSKQANETLKLKDNQNRPVVASFNQINGFFVVVEQVSNAKNELMLKTMYKARENYKDSLIYKKTLAKSQNSN